MAIQERLHKWYNIQNQKAMRINNIQIENCRIVQDVDMKLHPRINLFVGVNGAGKTTLLEALVKSIKCAFDLFASASLSTPTGLLKEDDITIGEKELLIRVTADLGLRDASSVSWSLACARKGENKSKMSVLSDLKSAIRGVRDDAGLRMPDDPASYRSLPVVAYYGTNRSVLEAPLKPRAHSFKQMEVYDGAFKGEANFKNFFIWFREREDIENEERHDLAGAHRDAALSSVRKAMSAFLPGFTDWRVRRQPLRMEVNKNGTYVRVNDLSDGEKCLLSMVGDLARRLAMANPGLEDPLLGTGVVLIDELELHLHPAWQYKVVPQLLATFPNIQFFATTHSPQVLSSVDGANLFAVSDGEVRAWPSELQTEGQSVERLLVRVFNAPVASETGDRSLLNDYARLLKEGAGFTPEANALYDRIVRMFGDADPVVCALRYRREKLAADGEPGGSR